MSFKEIKGHEAQIELLKQALRQNRIAPAYLFLGEDGIGKRLVAKIFTQAINCLDAEKGDPCGRCISCRKIEESNHPDVHWIALEGSTQVIKIEQIRQLKNEIYLKPFEARKKVFIIDQAQYLTPEASNAFLKVLEEPPPQSLIILVAAKEEMLLRTILSRCQKIKFSPLGKNQLKQLLNRQFGLDVPLSHYLSYFCEGRIGEALSLKDTPALKDKNRIIDNFVYSQANLLEEFDKPKFRQGLGILASWFRDLYFIKAGLSFDELINIDRKNDLLKIIARYSFQELDSIIKYISDNILYLEQNVNPKLLLSNLKVKLWKK